VTRSHNMRVHFSIPPFIVDTTVKARFAKLLEEFSKNVGVKVGIDSVKVEAVGHTWDFRTEAEFDKATKMPEVLDQLFVFFSDENRDIHGVILFAPDGGYASCEGPEGLASTLQTDIDRFVNDEYRRSLSAKAKQPPSTASETFAVSHCELDGDGLKNMVTAILIQEEGETAQIRRLEFSATGGTLTLNEGNVERILDNPALPAPYDEFGVTGRGEKARIVIGLARQRRSRVQVQGPLSWVRAKKMRLEMFFAQHPNSDPLARSKFLTGGLILLFVFGLLSVVGLTLNRLVWHESPASVIGPAAFFGVLFGLFLTTWIWDRYVSTVWVSAVPRQKGFFRSMGGVFAGLIVTELIYIVVGLAVGWLVTQP